MEFIMDMVHHNPGEAPTKTKFLNPEFLKEFGYNSQVFKHINTAVDFDVCNAEQRRDNGDEREWFDNIKNQIHGETDAAKKNGLRIFYHIDLFVLPKCIVEKYKDEICDENGKISLYKKKTLELHRAMIDAIFSEFSDVDGLIIRVGETYLHDAPYHCGNGAVEYDDREKEINDFETLLNFLREEVCVRHNKYLFFRTWDCFPDRFHADLDYYLAVTDRVEPHEKLIFSIKFTRLDFWRRVEFNEILAKGKHRQIVEVQCQREYEGKGAFPTYVMDGVINGFEENFERKGLADIAQNPLICGIYGWSRGGGWHGPYIKNEFWCELNAYVLCRWANNPDMTEEEVFFEFTENVMGLTAENAKKFRELCLVSNRAILLERYIEKYDDVYLKHKIMPCGNWMRDDQLGGLNQLGEIFEKLYKDGTLSDALNEKAKAVELWSEVKRIYESIDFNGFKDSVYIGTSIDYAIILSEIVYNGWRVMVHGFIGDKEEKYDKSAISDAIEKYDDAWRRYKELSETDECATLYIDRYYGDGIGESVNRYRDI